VRCRLDHADGRNWIKRRLWQRSNKLSHIILIALVSYHRLSRLTSGSIDCPGLLHFIYKSRQNVQVTSPTFDGIYENESDRNRWVIITSPPAIQLTLRLLTTYQQLHDSIHARSGQSTSLKLVYMRTDQEACLAWVCSSSSNPRQRLKVRSLNLSNCI